MQSIANQTNKAFTVYIGDDNSPENIEAIVQQFTHLIPIQYTKFPNNLGGKDLVAHWNRCVELTHNEEWIWLFCDDDVMDENCAQHFFDMQKKVAANVYRFATQVINESGNTIRAKLTFPHLENKDVFLGKILTGVSRTSLSEQIFSKSSFTANKGFINFPLAWASDVASCYAFAANAPITAINNSTVFFRMSGINISSNKNDFAEKELAYSLFLQWAKQVAPTVVHGTEMVREYRASIKQYADGKQWFFGFYKAIFSGKAPITVRLKALKMLVVSWLK